jgi:hypothetical protein
MCAIVDVISMFDLLYIIIFVIDSSTELSQPTYSDSNSCHHQNDSLIKFICIIFENLLLHIISVH